MVANFTDQDKQVQLRIAGGAAGAQFAPAWKAESLKAEGATASLTVPAKRGALVRVKGLTK